MSSVFHFILLYYITEMTIFPQPSPKYCKSLLQLFPELKIYLFLSLTKELLLPKSRTLYTCRSPWPPPNQTTSQSRVAGTEDCTPPCSQSLFIIVITNHAALDTSSSHTYCTYNRLISWIIGSFHHCKKWFPLIVSRCLWCLCASSNLVFVSKWVN